MCTLLKCLVVLIVCAIVGTAQECSSGCELHLNACSNINYPIYHHNSTEVQLADSLAAQIFQQAKLTNLPQQCQDSLSIFVCNVLFPSCNTSSKTPEAIRPCDQICHEFVNTCAYGNPALLERFTPPELKPFINCSDSSIYEMSTTKECSRLNNSLPLCNRETLAWTGTCVDYRPELAPLTGIACQPFVSRKVYVPVDSPEIFTTLDSIANVTAQRLSLALPILPINCYKYLLSILCPVLFPSCQEVYVPEYNQYITVGTTVCYEACMESTEVCRPFFLSADTPNMRPGCDKPDLQNVYTGPIYNLTVGMQCKADGTSCRSITVPVKCYGELFPEDPYTDFILPVANCTPETGKKTHPNPTDPQCGLKCPDASYTPEEWKRLVMLTQAGSSISLICMAFMICTYLMKAEKRKFPATTHIHEFVATSMFSITFLINGSSPETHVWCFDEGTYATQTNNYACAVQGFFFIFFGLALAAWCAVIAYIIFYSIVLRHQKDTLRKLERRNKWFILFGWGIPLIFAVSALAANKIGYGPPLAWCFIRFEGVGYGSVFSSDYSLFYIPAGILFVVILFMFWVTIVAIIGFYRKRASSESSVFITAQFRVLIFIFVIFAICITIFEWRFQIEAYNRKYDIANVGLKWSYCRIKYSLKLDNTSLVDCPGDHNPARVDFGHTAFESFLLSGIGILIFIAFGSDIGIYIHWHKALRLLHMGEWEKMKQLIIQGTDVFDTPSSSSQVKVVPLQSSQSDHLMRA